MNDPGPGDVAVSTLTSTKKRRPGEVRSRVDVGSEGGSARHRMCLQIDTLPMLCVDCAGEAEVEVGADGCVYCVVATTQMPRCFRTMNPGTCSSTIVGA